MKKNKKIKNSLFFLMILAVCTLVSCGLHNNKQEPINKEDAVFTMSRFKSNNWGAESARTDNSLTLESMIKYAIQDEYLQRARYEYVEKNYKEQSFLIPITRDENIHVYRMLVLLSKYKIAIPSDKSNEFFFKFPKTLEASFALLIKSESDSLAMYEKFLEQTEVPEEVKLEFTKQRDDSKVHLGILKEAMQNGAN
jgi:hypothetical protein